MSIVKKLNKCWGILTSKEKEESSVGSWAEKEIDIIINKEDPDEWDYGVSCYESALEAYRTLLCQGHSGMSFSITSNILIRLMEGKPLSPIKDTPDIWNDISDFGGVAEGIRKYQCTRMSSLFKEVHKNGFISYSDVDQCICVSADDPDDLYHCGFINRIIEKMYPITMPYNPSHTPYTILVRNSLLDDCNGKYNAAQGDHDHIHIISVKTPCGEIVNIDRKFKEQGREWVEIKL